MNQLITNQPLTMSSREIAELTGKRHSHVFRDIKFMLDELNEEYQEYVQIWTHPQNKQSYEEFILNKELTITLVSGYNLGMRNRIVKRWLELEEKQSQPSWIAQLSPEATIALNDLSNQLEVKTKKVEQLESLFHNGGTIAQFAKQMNGVNSQQVNNWLYANTNWLYDENKGKIHLTGRKQGQAKSPSWRCASYARDKYLTERPYEIFYQGSQPINNYEVQLLADGKKWLFDKYIAGKLPMKSNWNGEFTHKKDLN